MTTSSTNHKNEITTSSTLQQTSSDLCTAASNNFEDKSDSEVKESLSNDLSDTILISSSHEDPVKDLETDSNDEKVKRKVAKSFHFYFTIPRRDYRIRHWKGSKTKVCNVIVKEVDQQKLKQSSEVDISELDQQQSKSRDDIVKELDQQQLRQANAIDIDEFCDSVMNVDLETEPAEISKTFEELPTESEDIKQEISAISMIRNDIDEIISTLKRPKQQKAHPIHEPVILPIIVSRIIAHKKFMSHCIRGRQRGKRKRKYSEHAFDFTSKFLTVISCKQHYATSMIIPGSDWIDVVQQISSD
jgi:hypothetical protein